MKNFFKKSLALFACGILCLFSLFTGELSFSNAAAEEEGYFDFYGGAAGFKCYSYDVELTVNTDRTIDFVERIDVEALQNFNTFYKSLPTDSIYTDISATCEGNDEFVFYVIDNPDLSGFIDLCCDGNVDKGKRWVYEFKYTMQPNGDDIENGMILDVVGFGSSFELNDVDVIVRFPEKPSTCKRSYGGYDSQSELSDVTSGWSSDGKTLKIHEDKLELAYNSDFSEWTAEGITLQFTFEKGVLDGYVSTRLTTERTWLAALLAVILIGVAASLWSTRKKDGVIVPVVNVKAPDEMDPMEMGYLLDGTVDNEDVTSMIYYFASKGYLTVDFSDEDDPVLERVKIPEGGFVELPENAPSYQKILFNGLFRGEQTARVSDLNEKFYEYADDARLQVTVKKRKRYEKKSVGKFLVCCALGAAVGLFTPMLYGLIFVGGGYTPAGGALCLIVAIVASALLFALKENEFKRRKRVFQGVLGAIYVLGGGIFALGVASHVMTASEKLLLYFSIVISQILGYFTLARTDGYNRILGDILGFKDFIKVTEEDKIKFMLEQNPELYYDILPYAQVLDVTDEWEEKFANITLQPPRWASYRDPYFDYVMINRSMRIVSRSMLSRPQNSGTGVGRSGGGGSFGGFAGGGRGGGGFGGR